MQLYQPTITGSLAVSGSVSVSGSITIAGGGSIAGTASIATTALTASSADNFLTRGTLTAQTIVVQTITSSVDFVTGSTKFGSINSNTHQFTGSVAISGSSTTALNVNNGTLFVTSSGFVGIGTTNPTVKLDVGYDSNNRSIVRLSSNAANRMAAIRFDGNNAESGYIGYEGGSEIVSGGVQGDLVIRNMLSGKDIILDTNAGNVGIGTTNPGAKLEIAGAIIINPAVSAGTSTYLQFNNSGSVIGYVGSAAAINGGAASSITLGVASGAGLTISSTGAATFSSSVQTTGLLVGISSNAGYLARIYGGNGSQLLLDTTSQYCGIDIANSGTVKGGLSWDNTNAFFGLYTNSGIPMTFQTANTERMRITSGGDVLIARTGSLATGTSTSRFVVGGAVNVGSAVNNTSFPTKDDGGLGVYVGSGANAFQVWDDNQFSYPRFIVQRAGNVGVGAASPSEKLHISGSAVIRMDGGTGVTPFAIANNNSTGFRIYDYTAALDRMVITSGGNVGIGTTSPSAISTYTTLDIRGATGGGIRIGKTSTNPFNLQQDGTDAYLNNVANGAMYFYTNDTERMRIRPIITLTGAGGSGTGGATTVIGSSSMAGLLLVSIATQNVSAIFFINSSNAVNLISQSTTETRFSTTSANANTANVYISGTDLILQNNIQATRDFYVQYFGKT